MTESTQVGIYPPSGWDAIGAIVKSILDAANVSQLANVFPVFDFYHLFAMLII
jgi:hypothetical protein